MKRIYAILIPLFTVIYNVAMASPSILILDKPTSSILKNDGDNPVIILTLIQSFFLKVALPVIVVGASLYIAYELFTAEGDESKMKKAWKSVAYTAIALIAIALSYALVSLVSTLNF